MSEYEPNLREAPLAYSVWGRNGIDTASLAQMDIAMQLPITVTGAMMPDAHVGYGLPIGGVLATRSAVIPYAVGVDIACRMRLSVFDVSPHVLGQQAARFVNALVENTLFGAGKAWQGARRAEHPILEDPDWTATGFLASLQDKAAGQLGTSGSGNHFVEWGELKLDEDDADLGLKAGHYLALLSHSGSRGVGYAIAERFSRLAGELHPTLDKRARHLAWLPLEHSLGHEYWVSMELAGRYAAANHAVIHQRVAKAAGLKAATVVENHHNFAWRERYFAPDGTAQDLIVHRKGATPAAQGEMGVIPGSMGDPGFVVRGKGAQDALNSASHGAGRALSRKAARESLTANQQRAYLQERGVTLIGGDLDEAPQAYKDIHTVMAAQADLVDVIATFRPRVVRMDGRVGGALGGSKQARGERPSKKRSSKKNRR